MMLAEPGCLENLTESFSRQHLDDSLKSDCFGNLRRNFGLQQRVESHRISPHKTVWNNSEKDGTFTTVRAKTNENGYAKVSSLSSVIIPLKKVNTESQETYEEKQQTSETSPPILNSFFSYKSESERWEEHLSSSEEELRELCSNQNKTFHMSKEIPRFAPQVSPIEKVQGTILEGEKLKPGFVDVEGKNICRKRFRTTRESFKKRTKLSRPSLNLDKMLARRFSFTDKDLISNGNFCPIGNV